MNKLQKEKKIKSYILEILQLYPNVLSGRKNVAKYEERLNKNILITKKFIKNN